MMSLVHRIDSKFVLDSLLLENQLLETKATPNGVFRTTAIICTLIVGFIFLAFLKKWEPYGGATLIGCCSVVLVGAVSLSALLIAKAILHKKIKYYQELREYFQHQGGALPIPKIQRFLSLIPIVTFEEKREASLQLYPAPKREHYSSDAYFLSAQSHHKNNIEFHKKSYLDLNIWRRCHTNEELQLFIKKFGRELALQYAIQADDWIWKFFEGDLQKIDSSSLNEKLQKLDSPKKRWLFSEYAKKQPLSLRFKLAKHLFLAPDSPFKRPVRELLLDSREFNQSDQLFHFDWGLLQGCSSFLLKEASANHKYLKDLKPSIKEQLKANFSIVFETCDDGRVASIHRLLDVIFDEEPFKEDEEKTLLETSEKYLDGFYDQAIAFRT